MDVTLTLSGNPCIMKQIWLEMRGTMGVVVNPCFLNSKSQCPCDHGRMNREGPSSAMLLRFERCRTNFSKASVWCRFNGRRKLIAAKLSSLSAALSRDSGSPIRKAPNVGFVITLWFSDPAALSSPSRGTQEEEGSGEWWENMESWYCW